MDGPAESPAAVPGSEQGVPYQHVAMFEWSDNIKRLNEEFLLAQLGVRSATICPT